MTQAPTRRERERERHRNEILDAAEAVFSEKGYHGTTVEDVAARAEFSVGTLYNFFAGKDELYNVLIEERLQQLRDDAFEILDQADGTEDIIKMYIKGKIELSQKYFSFGKLYMRERLGDRFSGNKLWTEVVAPVHKEIFERLLTIFREGLKQGVLRKDLSAEDMAITIDAMTDGFMFEWFMHPNEYPLDEKYTTMVRLFFEGVKNNS